MQAELTLDLSKTYIYEGNEFILTGRIAERSVNPPPPRSRRSKRRAVVDITPEQDMMVEIKPSPKGRSIVGLPTESKWVRMSDLYAVVDVLEDDEDNDE